jgi:hypothetical protein
MGFYNESFVKKGRKEKTCFECEKRIKVGESAHTIPDMETYGRYDLCVECYPEVDKKFETIDDYLASKYGDEDEEDEE